MFIPTHPTARPRTRAVLLFATALVVGACQKPDDDLGVGVLDPEDLLGSMSIDTTTLVTATREEGPLPTSAFNRCALGSYVDPDFGLIKAGIVSQFRLTSNNVGAGSDNHALVADSLVLSLVFDLGSYGYGNLHPQRIRVFEVSEDLVLADTVYHNDHIPTIAQVNDLVLGSRGDVTPDPFNFPNVGGTVEKPQIRIPLEGPLAQRFLNAWGTSDLMDNTAFLQFFKGLYIVADNPAQGAFEGGIWYFDVLDAQSRLSLYYRNAEPGEEDTLSYTFAINASSVHYTVSESEASLAPDPTLNDQLTDSTLAQQRFFVQGLGGFRGRVYFPHITDHPAGTAVAKAELVVPLAGDFYPYYQPPSQLYAFRTGDEGQDIILVDQLGAAIGGLYDSEKREYRFNITRYIQRVINGTYANEGLSIVASSETGQFLAPIDIMANRAVLAGPAHAENPMKLRLTFTTY